VRPAAAGYHVPAGQHSRALFLLRVLCRRRGVIRFQHRWKINSILIRKTVAPIAVRTTSGRCSLKGVKSPTTGAVMSIIPLDLQRLANGGGLLDFPGRFLRPHLETSGR
jgi:hypothetical protein